jgi:hypothetical protein
MHHRLGFVIAVFCFFFLGQFLHAWLRAQAAKNSALNGITSYRQYIETNAAILVSRFFLAVLGLMAWSSYGTEICTYLSKQTDYLSWLQGNPVPLNTMTSGVYGFFGDSLLDLGVNFFSRWVPWLKKEVPPVPETKP